MTDAETEAVFQAVRSVLQTKAPILHNVWCLVGRRQPVTVARMAEVMWYPDPPPADRAAQQMRAGAFVAHLNKRIAKHDVIIKPGAARGTYQLYNRATWQEEQEAARLAVAPAARSQPPKLLTRKPRRSTKAPDSKKAKRLTKNRKGGKT